MIKEKIAAAFLILAFLGGFALGQEKKDVSLTLEDSIVQALKNNLNVAVEVLNPELASASVSRARQYFMPTFQVDLTGNRMEQLSTWSLQGSGTYILKTTGSTASVAQQMPFGGNITASLSYDYQKNNQLFQSYNPSYTSRLNFALTQPLLRNFGWAISRREIIVAQNDLEVSRSQFKTILINLVYSVETAYWNLVYSVENLKTLEQALQSGRDLLVKTKKEVEVGTKAPIEVLNAEATVARREADILQAEAMVKRSQDQLKTLLNQGGDPSAKGQNLRPADTPSFKPFTITLDEAFEKAMARRPDLEVAKSTIEIKRINFRYAKNQTLPQLDLQLVKASPGISGAQFIYDPNNPFLPPTPGDAGSAAQAFKDTFKFLYNNWTAGLTLTIPVGDVVGRANYTYAKLDLEQTQARLKNQEQQIYLEVSDAILTLETAAKSVDAYRIARELAAKQLEAEMKKLAVGMSTNYFVLTYQDALASARSMELKALIDYNVAVANIAKVTGSTLETRNITF
ncbi:MAG: TolC family protein [Candidatus Aminicenantes bacterium]|nr:TolC family protein [Candidatus Aminicenantes bacterium]